MFSRCSTNREVGDVSVLQPTLQVLQMNNKKKICIISEYFPPFIGGGQTHVYELTRALQDEFEFHVITNMIEGCKSYEVIDKIHVHRVGKIGGVKSLWRRFVYAYSVIQIGSKLHRKLGFDLIHAHVYPGSLAGYMLSKICRIPIVNTVHTVFSGIPKNDIGRLERFMQKIILGLPYDGIIAVSKDVKNKMMSLGIRPKTLVIISNGVNTEIFYPALSDGIYVRGELGINRDKLLVGFFGRLWTIKGVDSLIESIPPVLKCIPNAFFLIVGDGPLKEFVEKRVTELGLNGSVMMRKPVQYKEVAAYYRACDLIVVPSRDEACSLCALEAMATRIPVLAMAVGGLKEIVVHSKNGWLVESNSVAALSEGIVTLLSKKELRNNLAENGHQFVIEGFTWNMAARRLRDFYSTFIGDDCHA